MQTDAEQKLMIDKLKKLILFSAVTLAVRAFLFIKSYNENIDPYSEALVLSQAVIAENDIQKFYEDFGLGIIYPSRRPSTIYNYDAEYITNILYSQQDFSQDDLSYIEYKSQVGLQGIAVRYLFKYFDIMSVGKLYILYTVLLSGVLVLISHQLTIKYNIYFGASFLAVSLIYPTISRFARNLYWAEFLWYIPLLLGLMCLNYPGRRFIIYPLIFISIFIKCLCGYEFLSSILISEVMFIICDFIICKQNRKQLFKTFAAVSAISLSAFAAALLIHAYMYGGSDGIFTGLSGIFREIVQKRTYGSADNFEQILSESLNSSVFTVLAKYFTFEILGKVISIVTVVTAGLVLYKVINKQEEYIMQAVLFVLSLLSPLSWLILAKSHSYVHISLNISLFALGYMQVCGYILVKRIADILNKKTLRP